MTIALGFAALVYGLFGSGLGTTADPRLDGARCAAHLHRRRALRDQARPAARGRARAARRDGWRRRRQARARQRPSQPAAHRLDRRGADDRPRARHARRDARGGDHEHVPRRRRRPLRRRLRDHGAEQLLADPDRRGRGGRRSRRRRGRSEHPRRRGARLRQHRVRDRGRRRTSARCLPRTGWRAHRPCSPSSATTARSSTTATPRTTTSAIGSPIQVIVPVGQPAAARDRGHLRPARRRLAVRLGHVLERGLRSRIRLAAEPLQLRAHGGRRDGGEHEGARGLARGLPEREGADEGGVRRQPDQRPRTRS